MVSQKTPVDISYPVSGRVVGIDLSGIGPNSGEVTLVIKPDGEAICEVFAGIMPEPPAPRDEYGIEPGVFAAYVSMAVMAYATKTNVTCEYLRVDKNRMFKLATSPG
jgi:hypothetical protein